MLLVRNVLAFAAFERGANHNSGIAFAIALHRTVNIGGQLESSYLMQATRCRQLDEATLLNGPEVNGMRRGASMAIVQQRGELRVQRRNNGLNGHTASTSNQRGLAEAIEPIQKFISIHEHLQFRSPIIASKQSNHFVV